jgi:hypothetical protein
MGAIHYAAETCLCDDLNDSDTGSDRPDSASLGWDLRRALLSKGIPIDVPTEVTVGHPGRATPLQFSCKAGHEHAVRCLLNRGADPDHVDNNGRTALHWVCDTLPGLDVGNRPWICRELLKRVKEISIELKDAHGKSALEIASETDPKYQAQAGRYTSPLAAVREIIHETRVLANFQPLHTIIQGQIRLIQCYHERLEEEVRHWVEFAGKGRLDEDYVRRLLQQGRDYAARRLAVVRYRRYWFCK